MMLRCRRSAALLLLTACAASAAELRVGRAALKLLDVSAADELYVKALLLDDGETRAAMVVCDLPALDPVTIQTARRQIAAQSTIAESNIMIAATGTHAAREKTPRGTAVAARLAEAVRLAVSSAQPASAWAGAGREDATGFYNRFLMTDGTVRANPGKMNPDIVQPAGEADPDLVVVRFVEPGAGQTLAIFGSYSLRASIVEGSHLSADYPGVIARTLGRLHGPELVTLWSTGAGANVTHIDARSPAPQPPGAAEAQRVGTILSGESLKAGARSLRLRSVKLGVVRESVKLAAAQPGRPALDVEVQVIALGDSVAWVGLPGDLWSELGRAIRKASPFPYTLLTGLADTSAGVLPSRKGYPAGSPDPGVRTAAGSGEIIADAAVRLLAAARRLAEHFLIEE